MTPAEAIERAITYAEAGAVARAGVWTGIAAELRAQATPRSVGFPPPPVRPAPTALESPRRSISLAEIGGGTVALPGHGDPTRAPRLRTAPGVAAWTAETARRTCVHCDVGIERSPNYVEGQTAAWRHVVSGLATCRNGETFATPYTEDGS
jgi:hypothetical protein